MDNNEDEKEIKKKHNQLSLRFSHNSTNHEYQEKTSIGDSDEE